MGLIANILFPVDFSSSCVAMGPYVKRAAAIFGARISLLTGQSVLIFIQLVWSFCISARILVRRFAKAVEGERGHCRLGESGATPA